MGKVGCVLVAGRLCFALLVGVIRDSLQSSGIVLFKFYLFVIQRLWIQFS